jgi:putative acetyltransferase
MIVPSLSIVALLSFLMVCSNIAAHRQDGKSKNRVRPAKSPAYSRPRRERNVDEPFHVRPIRPADDAAVAEIVRQVLREFGGGGPGFADSDPWIDALHEVYQRPGAAYHVLTRGDRVVGGGGIGPLLGGAPDVCELQKMYFLPEARGRGQGRRMLELCLTTARQLGYARCYLETLEVMRAARALYEKNGFRPLEGPMGATGHGGCDAWYLRHLTGGADHLRTG